MTDRYIIPDDISRCFNHDCENRQTCLRYLQRKIAKDHRRVVVTDNLNPFQADECNYYHPAKEGDAEYEPG